MTSLLDFLISPFADYTFMRRALAACVILSMSAAPLGLFMNLRRMTLVGDAMSHAILPGVAVAFMVGGTSIGAMTVGGLLGGIVVALMAISLVRFTQLKEDASFSLFYLLSLAGGVIMMSHSSRNIDLLHILFGNILGIDNLALGLIAGVSSLTLLLLAAYYRSFVLDCFDPAFLKVQGGGRFITPLFFLLLVINLVASFQALGTLMALGLMILPATAARFWTRNIDRTLPLCLLLGVVCSYIGLVVSYHGAYPAGPTVVLVMGLVALLSAIIGPVGSVRQKLWP